MSGERKNEIWGWLLGWSGGFIWVLILAFVFLARGDIPQGLVGCILGIIAAAIILTFSPWRHPTQPYWKLMVFLYFILFLSFAWLIWSSGGVAGLGLTVWSLFLLLPILLPLYLMRNKRWIETK
jgi:drug/metabolite transporter (DMT)-like permease